MKKIFVIFLLLALMLHHAGYYFVFVSLNEHAEEHFQAKLYNDGFDKAQLKEVSIPITLPYQKSDDKYRKVGKKLSIKGTYYRVVKMKYHNDTLHLVYIDDVSTTRLMTSLQKWVGGLTESDRSDNQDSSILKVLKQQYYLYQQAFLSNPVKPHLLEYNTLYLAHYQQVYIGIPSPPPKSGFSLNT